MKKNNTITYMKALAIILMVVGHCDCKWQVFVSFFHIFHIPLFFIVSGYCFKLQYLSSFLDFFKKKVRGLYVPFVKWNLIFILLHNIFFYLHIYDGYYGMHGLGSSVYSIADTLKYVQLTLFQMRGAEQLLAGYWFINTLFISSIYSWLIMRLVPRVEHALLLSAGILCFTHAINFHIVFLNYDTRTAMAMFLFIAGHTLARKKIGTMNGWCIMASALFTFIGSFFWMIHPNYTKQEGWQIFPYTLNAVLMTWALYSLFSRWKETQSVASRFMRFIGENTLTILTWHLLAFKTVSLYIIWHYHLSINRLAEFPTIEEYAFQGWWVVYAVVSIIVCCAIILVRTKFTTWCQNLISTQRK